MTTKKTVKTKADKSNVSHETIKKETHHTTHHAEVKPSVDNVFRSEGKKMSKRNFIFLAVALVIGIVIGQFVDLSSMNIFGSKGLIVYALSDKTCASCDTSSFVQTTQNLFPDAKIIEVDISDKQGKKLVDKYELAMLPAYIFVGDIEDTDAWTTNPSLASVFEDTNGAKKLLDTVAGASLYLDPEKQAEQEAMLANYVGANIKALGTNLEKPRFDYFVMSFCPYGNPADEAASEVYKALGNSVEIVPHYIMNVANNDIQSLHGVLEGNEDVRELCALENLGMDKFFQFTLKVNDQCDAKNADDCWEGAANDAGLTTSDISEIKSCYDAGRLEIAQKEDDLIQSLRIIRQGQLVTPSASPTLMINGETYTGGRDAESIKTALCSKFDGNAPAACNDVITAETSAPEGNC